MADRLNDTDPQSPAAITSRTDPGLGSPPVLVVGPRDPLPPQMTPPDASIEELLDGITGPRPPPSSRRAGPDAARAYSAARPAPSSRPMPPAESPVLSPEPPAFGEREALTVPRGFDGPPLQALRRPEEKTAFTGRRAMARNVGAVVMSAGLFTAGMMGLLRWKEQSAPRSSAAAAIVVAPLPPSPEVAAPSGTIVIVSPPPPPAQAAAASPPPPVAAAAPSASAPSRAVPLAKRVRTAPRASSSAGSLDDLNREISH